MKKKFSYIIKMEKKIQLYYQAEKKFKITTIKRNCD